MVRGPDLRQPLRSRALEVAAGRGRGGGPELTLDTPSYDPHPTVAEFVKSELAKVGVTVTINTITADEWYSKVYKEHDFQATLQEHVNTRDVVWYGNPTFYWGYNNEAVTALVDEAEQASTEDEQTEKLRAANEQIAADAASAWLYLYPQIVVARSNVSGYGVNGLNLQFCRLGAFLRTDDSVPAAAHGAADLTGAAALERFFVLLASPAG